MYEPSENYDPNADQSLTPQNRDRGMDKNHVHFFRKPVYQKAESKVEKRPIFKSVEYVRVMIPGDKHSISERPVRDNDRRVYATQYAAFLANKDQDATMGTPLASSGIVPPERIEELAYFKIKTVEHLAGVGDGALQNLGPGSINERQRARDFLDSAKGAAAASELRTELEKRDAEINALKEQMAQVLAASQAPAPAEPDRKGKRQ